MAVHDRLEGEKNSQPHGSPPLSVSSSAKDHFRPTWDSMQVEANRDDRHSISV